MNGAVLLMCATLVAYDGDTFKCNGVSMRPMGDGAPFISGFDSPEIGYRAKCEREHELGLRAKKRFQELLDTPGVQVWDSGKIDNPRYNRPLVWVVMPDGRRAGAILIEEGLARVWKPRHKIDWCS